MMRTCYGSKTFSDCAASIRDSCPQQNTAIFNTCIVHNKNRSKFYFSRIFSYTLILFNIKHKKKEAQEFIFNACLVMAYDIWTKGGKRAGSFFNVTSGTATSSFAVRPRSGTGCRSIKQHEHTNTAPTLQFSKKQGARMKCGTNNAHSKTNKKDSGLSI